MSRSLVLRGFRLAAAFSDAVSSPLCSHSWNSFHLSSSLVFPCQGFRTVTSVTVSEVLFSSAVRNLVPFQSVRLACKESLNSIAQAIHNAGFCKDLLSIIFVLAIRAASNPLRFIGFMVLSALNDQRLSVSGKMSSTVHNALAGAQPVSIVQADTKILSLLKPTKLERHLLESLRILSQRRRF